MRTRALIAAIVGFALLAGCGGGGGGGGSSLPAGGGTPAPAATTIGTTPTSITIGTAGTMSITTTSGSTTANVTTSAATPIGSGVQSIKPQSATAILYVTLTATSSITIDFPTFTSSTASGVAYAAASNASWNYTDYSGNGASPQVFTASGTIPLTANTPVYFALYTGTPASGQSNVAFLCPTSDSATAIRTGGATTQARRMTRRGRINAKTASNRIAVIYDRATYQRSTASFTRNEQSVGGTLTRTHDYAKIGKVVHVLSVPAANTATVMAALKAQAGVISVGLTGERRYTETVSNANVVWSNANDPYFNGFQTPLPAPTAGATAPPSTYHALPYAELDSVPGQWDMHAMGIEKAFSYTSAASNTGNVSNPKAIGDSSINIAIIDTGVDTGLSELSGKITRQECFITSADGTTQSTSNFVTDPDGHGTDVAGIAAADINNGLGFAGAGGNTSIMAYRVFPTPDNTCEGNNPDAQCGADTVDIADAIDDAVTNHANIISMSLGGSGCSSPGTDSDPTEGAAVANAIAHSVIVIAASGNEGASTPDSPGCDSGVISVGATSLDDGAMNGTGSFGGSLATPIEYVASYSNAGPTLSAPGGDPNGGTDNDDLHWIENIWTSTPFDTATDAGNCNGDYPNDTGPGDCRILIAGTSMATPHVAGVAALILAVGGNTYQNPPMMQSFLCNTGDDLNTQAGHTGSPGTNQGCKRVNAYRAIATLVGDSPLP